MTDRKGASRLGRGLASLMGEAPGDDPSAVSRTTISITRLAPGPFQPRREMPEEALEELASSIRRHGILQPILVRPDPGSEGCFQIIAGERRWRAAQRAGLHEVPVHVRTFDDAGAMAAALIENLQRQDLNAIEEAEGLRRLSTDFGLTQEMVAISVGKSRSHVANTVRLLSLPNVVQFDVRRGALSAGHARALLTHPDPAKAAAVVLARGLTVRQTEALGRESERHPSRSQRPGPVDDVSQLERELADHLGLRVKITSDGHRGELRLAFASLDQLDGLVQLLKGDSS